MNKKNSSGKINVKEIAENAEVNLAKRTPKLKKSENFTMEKFMNFIQLIYFYKSTGEFDKYNEI